MFWVALTALALVPLFRDAIWIFDSTYGAKALLGLLEASVALALLSRSPCHPPNALKVVSATWLVLLVIAALSAEHTAIAIVRATEVVVHLLFGLAIFARAQAEPGLTDKVLRLFTAGFVVYFIAFVFFRVTLPWTEFHDWATGIPGFSNVRHLGYVAMIVLGMATAVATGRERVGLDRWLGRVAMTSCWCVLFWAGGRGPIVALVAATVAVVVLPIRPAPARALIWLPLTAILGAALAWVLAVPDFGIWRILGMFEEAGSLAAVSSGRMAIWIRSIELLAVSPWFGLGPDGFFFVLMSENRLLVQPHNVLLQSALEWGIPGAAVAGASMVVACVWLVRGPHGTRGGIRYVSLVWAILATLALAMVDGPLYHGHATMLFVVVFALAASMRVRSAPRDGGSPTVIALLVPAIAVFALHTWSIERATDHSRDPTRQDGILELFPTGYSDYRSIPATRRVIATCIQYGVGDCVAIADAAATGVRPPFNREFRALARQIESGAEDAALESMMAKDPTIRQ